MPIFEYICKDCNQPFEALVYGSQKAACPVCHGHKLEQRISVFSVGASSRPSASPQTGGCGGGCACAMNAGANSCLDD